MPLSSSAGGGAAPAQRLGRLAGVAACSTLTLLVLLMLGVWRSEQHGLQLRTVRRSTLQRLDKLRELAAPYRLLNDTDVYARYAKVYDRLVRYPDGKVFAFDVWGRNWRGDSFAVVIVVPYNARARTVTLISEYNVAHHRFVYSFPTGMVDAARHTSPRDAAQQELGEEARLQCNTLVSLLSERGAIDGVPQDKYQRERVYMYLCIDEQAASSSPKRDREERDLHIERGVSLPELRALLRAGTFQSNNIAAAYLALEELELRGHRVH